MKSWKKLAAILSVLALILAACGGDGSTDTTADGGPDTTADGGVDTTAGEEPGTTTGDGGGEPIIAATSLPLTGDFAIPAELHRVGYQLCVDLINERGGVLGRELVLEVEDNQSDQEIAVTQYERMVAEADILFGTFSSLLTGPTSAIAEQNGMVYPVPSGGAQRIWERGFENIFYFQAQPAEGVGSAAVNALLYYQEQGLISEDDFPETAAVVYADDPFAAAGRNGLAGGTVNDPATGEVLADLSPGFLADAGIDIVFDEQWPVGFTDWTTFANSIASSGAESVWAATASVDEAISLVQALQQVGHQPSFVWMSQGAQNEFRDELGGPENGLTMHTVWHPSIEFVGTLAGEEYSNLDFVADFTERTGNEPSEDEAIPFAVCQGMEQAMIGAGSTDNAAMQQWLRDRTADDPVRTVLGDFHWDERGLPIGRDYLLNQWQDGTLQFVYPVEEGLDTVDMVFPKPDW
ncbi:MAG TPA: amino acid ABC transporter substrate-binding protein [Acidimicrobiia bacterium]|nr:amino acid ABC transporter substrate-binding protein [Acidimicrobiia bacterium]